MRMGSALPTAQPSDPPTMCSVRQDTSDAVVEMTEQVTAEQLPATVPEGLCITARGAFSSEDEARKLATNVQVVIHEFSRTFDLSRLDGVTVALDYAQALIELDRGFKTTHTPSPSTGSVVGVAMTPSVLRDGVLKSHIVFNAEYIASLMDADNLGLDRAIHIVAHECAHVEITSKFENSFPGVLLRKSFKDLREWARSAVILACWDEYAATWRSAGFGEDPTEWYEETLITHLGTSRQLANEAIKAYRLHGRLNDVYCEVRIIYGNLLKYAAYCLGNMAGQSIKLSQRSALEAALSGHFFEPYFHQLDEACKEIAAQYGLWQDYSLFEVIGDVADSLVTQGGIRTIRLDDGQFALDIPLTPETTP